MKLKKLAEDILGRYLNESISNDDKITKFVDYMEGYQSNHYGNFNTDMLVNSYNDLPKNIKRIISPNSTNNLFRGTDGLSYKSGISFTKNKGYADTFGVYTIPFTELKDYIGLIDTEKLVNFLDKNGINHGIGDDEGEVIVLNPVFKKRLNKNIEYYKN
jgi:hypothetical protein